MKAVITVIGKDMVGIIAKVSAIVADANANILEITQSVLQDYFAMIMLVDLSAMAEEVWRETNLLETGREVALQAQPLVVAQADPRLIKQAFRVLVDNGVKYTPRGGRVELSVRAENGLAQLSVTDSGAGIPREELSQIFRRFYRADKSRNRQTGGTGLGLPIADWIAQRHKGWIEVTSREGLGSRFVLVIPQQQSTE